MRYTSHPIPILRKSVEVTQTNWIIRPVGSLLDEVRDIGDSTVGFRRFFKAARREAVQFIVPGLADNLA
jgi:hypothetical protein